ncbi:MAG: hypothetical protein BroJett018_28700 [Chloroflexota bacterium]|nr:hypothetical protein [Chloroflexota bacterium]NOG63693.1 hypothetical protein [Chloroflexota bacterium]GIK65076.1 MAG: hypothetical protein BroJett018_28700 [Chloroflexota bacterium]
MLDELKYRSWPQRSSIHHPLKALIRFEQAINSLQGVRKIFWMTSFLLVVLALHSYGAYQHLHERNIGERNTGYQKNDQEDYMLYAKALYFSDYRYAGDGNRMPLYPALQSLHYSPTISMEDYFVQGKYLNVGLSILLLIGLFGIFLHYFSPLAAMNLMLVTTFQLYMFRAAYFQAELLYYTLSFGAFGLMLRLLHEPSWKFAILTGIMAGLAHLTKASFLPALFAFGFVMGLKMILMARREKRWKPLLNNALSLGLVLGAFLLVLYPYISRVKDTFGHYFYNVNTTFYIWYDDKAEVEAPTSTKAHGDSIGWPDLPDDKLPSLQKYLRETTPREFWERMAFGAKLSFRRHILPGSYGYSPYIVGYPLIVLLLALMASFDKSRRAEFLRRINTHRYLLLYVVLYLVGYSLLYLFYMQISGGQRFMLALFLPLMFSATMAMNLPLFQTVYVNMSGERVRWVSLANGILFFMFIAHALYNVLWVVDDFYAGD